MTEKSIGTFFRRMPNSQIDIFNVTKLDMYCRVANAILHREETTIQHQPVEINVKTLIGFIIMQFQIHVCSKYASYQLLTINITSPVIDFCPLLTQSSLIMHNING